MQTGIQNGILKPAAGQDAVLHMSLFSPGAGNSTYIFIKAGSGIEICHHPFLCPCQRKHAEAAYIVEK